MDELRPLFDYVLVKELPAGEDVRESGVVLPATRDEAQRPPQHGIVLAVGPGLDWWEHVGVVMPVSVGDKIVFPFHSGTYVQVNEENLLMLRVGQILGVVELVRAQGRLQPHNG